MELYINSKFLFVFDLKVVSPFRQGWLCFWE